MPRIVLLTLLATIPPLATDMYLPAMPTIQAEWDTSFEAVSMTMVLFFGCWSLCMLIHGPLSDRFGRKPVLLGGMITFILGSILCGLSQNLTMLIVGRIVQAVGGAAASTMSMALSRDWYEGAERQRVLALMGILFALVPMVAPQLGGWALLFASWHWIFIMQAAMAGVTLCGVVAMTEPDIIRTEGGVIEVVGRYRHVLGNPDYVMLVLIFSVSVIQHFAFIGSSSDMFISGFGVSEQEFGYYFALNALGFMVGSFICRKISGRFNDERNLIISLSGLFMGAMLLWYTGGRTPLGLALCMFVITMFGGMTRPISISMILGKVDRDIGAASSIMMFTFSMIGSLAMAFIAQDWAYKPQVLGYMALAGSGGSLLGLLLYINLRSRNVAASEAA